MTLPTLHVLGLAHTRTTDQFSHCAFTGKVKRMSPMMRSLGYHTVHYGVEGAESGANEQVDVMTTEEQVQLMGFDPSTPGHNYALSLVQVDKEPYPAFNRLLLDHLKRRVQPGDLVLHAFSYAYSGVHGQHAGIDLESGIGYDIAWAPHRVYESYAQLHWHLGKNNRRPNFYEWVVPNSYDPAEWTVRDRPGQYVLFMGRISESKGLNVVVAMAQARPDLQFVICGQGDATPFLTEPNITYRAPVHGRERDQLLGEALCVVCPSSYVEPFGGVAVEAMMTGTPVLSSPWGAFMETIQHGRTGFHCRVLNDWLTGLTLCETIDRQTVAALTRGKYSMFTVARQYDTVFKMLNGLYTGKSWYTNSVTF